MTQSGALQRLTGVYAMADDDPRWKHDPRAVVEAALAGGARALQLRLKHTQDRDALALTRWAVQRTRAANALLFVNDRYDLALLAGADGVHLGEQDLPPERLRSEDRRRLLVGLSTHTLEQVTASRERPVDYIGFGPLFGTASKHTGYPARGIEMLHEAVQLARGPVVAIGGIDLERIGAVATAGASAAAVISAISAATDPRDATRSLQAKFKASLPRSAP